MNATWTWTTDNGSSLYKTAFPDLSALDAGCCLNLMVTCRKETFVKPHNQTVMTKNRNIEQLSKRYGRASITGDGKLSHEK